MLFLFFKSTSIAMLSEPLCSKFTWTRYFFSWTLQWSQTSVRENFEDFAHLRVLLSSYTMAISGGLFNYFKWVPLSRTIWCFSLYDSCCFIPLPNPHHQKTSALYWSAGYGVGLKVDGVRRHRRPPASSNGQWGIVGPFQSLQSASATAQLHGRRLSLCLVNYQPAPAFTVMHTQVAR